MKKVVIFCMVVSMCGLLFGQTAKLGMQMKLVGTWHIDSVKCPNSRDNTKYEALPDDRQVEIDKIEATVQFTGQYEAIVTLTNKANRSQKTEKKYHWEIKDNVYRIYDKEKNKTVEEKIPTIFLTSTQNKYVKKMKIINLTKKKMDLQGPDFVFTTMDSELVLSKM
jgi:hypothetical protein